MTLGPLRFTNALGGTANFIYPGPTVDMQSPASAGAVDGRTYTYYAQSFDMSQWEIGTGAYTASSGTFARTAVLANSLGTTAKINFSNAPQVFVVDLVTNVSDLSDTAWTAYTPNITSGSGIITTLGAVSGRYKKIGKTVTLQITVNITTAGTGASNLIATLPVNAIASTWQIGAAADLTTGNVGRSLILNSDATKIFCSTHGGGTFISSGAIVIISMTYEVP